MTERTFQNINMPEGGYAYGTFCKCGFHLCKRKDGTLYCDRVKCQRVSEQDDDKGQPGG